MSQLSEVTGGPWRGVLVLSQASRPSRTPVFRVDGGDHLCHSPGNSAPLPDVTAPGSEGPAWEAKSGKENFLGAAAPARDRTPAAVRGASLSHLGWFLSSHLLSLNWVAKQCHKSIFVLGGWSSGKGGESLVVRAHEPATLFPPSPQSQLENRSGDELCQNPRFPSVGRRKNKHTRVLQPQPQRGPDPTARAGLFPPSAAR